MPRKAKVQPVLASGPEFHSDEVPPAPLPDLELPATGAIPRGESIVLTEAQQLHKDYLAELAFNEEPITIRIEPTDEENAPVVVDCWVNGKGAEVLDPRSGKWMELNCLPIGGIITTRRKYVEVIARAKVERIKTRHSETGFDQNDNADTNRIQRTVSRRASFSVIEDKNPRGAAWLTKVLSER